MELEGGSKAPNIQGSFKSHLLMHLHVKMNKAQMMEAFLGQKKKKKSKTLGAHWLLERFYCHSKGLSSEPRILPILMELICRKLDMRDKSLEGNL